MNLGRYGKLLAICGLLSLFVGCGGKTQNDAADSKKAEEKFVQGTTKSSDNPMIKEQMAKAREFNQNKSGGK